MKHTQIYFIAIFALLISSCTTSTTPEIQEPLLTGSWDLSSSSINIFSKQYIGGDTEPSITTTTNHVGIDHNSIWNFEESLEFTGEGSYTSTITTLTEEEGKDDIITEETTTTVFNFEEVNTYLKESNTLYIYDEGNLSNQFDIIELTDQELTLGIEIQLEGEIINIKYEANTTILYTFQRLD